MCCPPSLKLLADGPAPARAGAVCFIFDTALDAKANVDRIEDFNRSDDTIRLERDVFRSTGAKGWLSQYAFHGGTEGTDKEDGILFDKKHGNLVFDRDGTQTKYYPVKFAYVNDIGGRFPTVDHTDFMAV